MNLGISEMLFIFFLALIIFGPKRLPEIGRQIGKTLAEFKRASNEFKSQLESEMRQIELEQALEKEKQAREQAVPSLEGTVASDSSKGEAAPQQPDTPLTAAAETHEAEQPVQPAPGNSGVDAGTTPDQPTLSSLPAAEPESSPEAVNHPHA